ncbi:hypothetical protein G7Z17_g33 [Cylindrodendrum hubeiense]|uniref:Uncharacterized protein n=1 Tax=Cylindrodendrum hubeiense TaxID=595255 RepID=A0A9P5HQI8_9HYPO|nr:hypothetical protein G7Z17_g33 [Cylindrodendrum hubeiense]
MLTKLALKYAQSPEAASPLTFVQSPKTTIFPPRFDKSPEAAFPSDAPEVYHPPLRAIDDSLALVKEDYPLGHSAAAASTYAGTYYQPVPPSTRGGKRFHCGCSLAVLILSIIIAILSITVIGLAAGTGIATNNYNDANQKLEALSSSYDSLATATGSSATASDSSATATSSSAESTSTNYSALTNGCSDTDETTTGVTYTSKFFDNATYIMYCNKDAQNNPLFSLFTGDFDGCMEACTAWNTYSATNATACRAVSFIPFWANITDARNGNSAGDCWLKPGPQSKGNLTTPNIGTECHAAIWDS